LFIGGLDSLLIHKINERLLQKGFMVSQHPNPKLHGIHIDNICNLSKTGKGVQIEIAKGLRRRMFTDLTPGQRRVATRVFFEFVEAIRGSLDGREM
jgi:phage replication-related protein YjqB (UPF0714/DUF867 family)